MSFLMQPILAESLTTFITPLWMLSIGATAGFVCLLIIWGIVALVSRRAAKAIPGMISEGVLLWITYLVFAMVALCIFAGPWMPYKDTWNSLSRMNTVGKHSVSVNVPAGAVDEELEVNFRPEELEAYSFNADGELLVALEKGKTPADPLLVVKENPNKEDSPDKKFVYEWDRGSAFSRRFEVPTFKLYVTNQNPNATQLSFTNSTKLPMPEVYALLPTMLSVIAIYAIYFLMMLFAPRMSVIAVATAREAISQPLYLILTGVGIAGLVFFVILPYHTFGEDVKMLQDVGLTFIKILAIIIALWTASISVSDEIEGRTALTLLSKPIGRKQFVLGKFFGISWAVLLMFVILGAVLLILVSYKVLYDAREGAGQSPDWQQCFVAVVATVPGIFLAFLEAVVLASISVAISTRLSMMPNLIICGSIYVLGHLVPTIVQSSAGDIEFVKFSGQFISTIIPVLEHFDVQAAITAGNEVPLSYLGWTTLYAALYCAAAMLLALFLFQDRDLA